MCRFGEWAWLRLAHLFSISDYVISRLQIGTLMQLKNSRERLWNRRLDAILLLHSGSQAFHKKKLRIKNNRYSKR
jgi:hypothetical protein